ncbi:MAG: hypothetical protein HYR85_11880 [Planctomycetes bacterium]|nr:hypothetical protein [Planctomycetota bacterium]MBI3843944.1 hypothetical protein [Planctomycetota bacterium]
MNSGLAYLLRMGIVGKYRYVRRRMRGAKGALFTIGAVAILLLLIAPQVAIRYSGRSMEHAAHSAESIRLWGPAVLLAVSFLGALSARGVYFKPAEVDFLFPAPVSRRELLLYNVLSKLGTVALSALWISIFMSQHATHWYAAVTALFLGFAFVQLVGQTAGLLLANVSERLTKPVRRVAGFLVVAPVIGLFVAAVGFVPRGMDVVATARTALDSPLFHAISLITRPFVEVFVASDVPTYLAWMAPALVVLVALVGAMMALDVAFLEASLVASERIQARLRRLRTGGGLGSAQSSAAPAVVRRGTLPIPPRFAGVGPIAWRQAVAMRRDLRSILVILVIAIPVTLVPILVSRGGDEPKGAQPAVIGCVVLTLMMTQNFAFDFRRDLDRMAFLKSLPLRPVAVAAGQLVPATVLFTVMQLAMLTTVAVATRSVSASLFAGISALLPFVNWIVAGVDNTIFLVMPHRIVPEDGSNMPFMGRTMVVMFLKMLAIFVIGGVSALAGLGMWALCGHSLLAGAIGIGVVLAAAAIAVTELAGRAFAAFDVTRDTPA